MSMNGFVGGGWTPIPVGTRPGACQRVSVRPRVRGVIKASASVIQPVQVRPTVYKEPEPSPIVPASSGLWDAVRREWRRAAICVIAVLTATGAAICMPLAFAEVTRTILSLEAGQPGGHERLLRSVVRVAALYIIEPLATIVWVRTVCRVTEEIILSTKKRIFRDILNREIEFFDTHSSGELTSAVAKDVGEIRDMVWNNLGRDRGVRAVLEAIGVVVMLTCIQPKIAIVFCVIVPIAATIVTTLGKKLGKLAMSESVAFAAVTSKVAEVFSGVRTVKSFGGEEKESAALESILGEAGKVSLQIGQLKSGVEAANRFAIYSTLLTIAIASGFLVMAGQLQATRFISFIGYVYMLSFAVQGISYTAADVGRGRGTLERLSNILGSNASADEPTGVKKLPKVSGTVLFRNISFAYPTRPQKFVLKDFSVNLEPHKVTALVGPSGAGKSTSVALLSRFYKPQEGTITLDGANVNDLEKDWYVDQVALVSQNPMLFAGSIRENICYGVRNRTISEDELMRAIKFANAEEFIQELPDGIETVLGERGGGLSGGQRQRIAIARAVLKDAPILILDEATSALDAQSEKLVQDALNRLMDGRTALVIAHRLSTILSADKICVVHDGKVVEEGSHRQLMRQGDESIYRRLMQTQTSAFIREELH
ncbi:hypothetical protein NDN08_007707 [Rhodosorus marinus]|uniref:Probable ATP-dependent transporter ycf16 n=1 Tax=Rhodosorus marinus TaxID=101924 RepID=A0AAV8V2J4_9RHOD|nr:hypothetical protein NDN08_007707 [Rhodosorus marinus]